MSYSLFFVLVSMPMVPKVPSQAYHPSSLLQPIHLTLLPASSFTTLPPSIARFYDIARSFERLAWAWGALAACGSIARLYQRLRYGRKGTQDPSPSGLQSRKILNVSPITMVEHLHLLAWRLATILPKDAAYAGRWPRDIGTFLGVAGGLMASWGELQRLLRLFGWGRGTSISPIIATHQLIAADPQTGPSWSLSIFHVLLSIHRLLLSIRILSAAFSTSSTLA